MTRLLKFCKTFEVKFFDPGDAIVFVKIRRFGDDFDLVAIVHQYTGLGRAEVHRRVACDLSSGVLEFGGSAREALGIGHG